MVRAAWMTDIHLNFLDDWRRRIFLESVQAAAPDVLLISGDIGEAPTVERYLEEMLERLSCRICVVLGNHDFYRGSIADVRQRIAALARRCQHLHYLTAEHVVALSPSTSIVGHDGWADARMGNFLRSEIMLNDYLLIAELACGNKTDLARTLNALGDEAAAHLRAALPEALRDHRQVVVLTHVPPFPEACSFRNRPATDDWLPHFACQAVGDVLREVMQQHLDRRMLVLCGHTHGAAQAEVLPNLTVMTGGSEYGEPVVQRVFEFE